jgi:hypothetical protein
MTMSKLTEPPTPPASPTQAALLLIVASAGKDGMDPDTREARTLTAAMEDFACELSILGIKAPKIAPR